MNRHFPKKTYKIFIRYMEKCTASLSRKCKSNQNEILCTPVRMAIIYNNDNQCWWWCGKTTIFSHRGNIKCWSHHEKQYGNFSKLKIQLIYDPAILHLGMYPKALNSRSQRKYLHSHVHSNINNNIEVGTLKCTLMDKGIKKSWLYSY